MCHCIPGKRQFKRENRNYNNNVAEKQRTYPAKNTNLNTDAHLSIPPEYLTIQSQINFLPDHQNTYVIRSDTLSIRSFAEKATVGL